MNKCLAKFPVEFDDYLSVYNRIVESEQKRHPSVKNVHVIDGSEPSGDQEIIDHIGFAGYEVQFWNTSDTLAYPKANQSPNGGFVKVAKLPSDKKIWTFVFVRCDDCEGLIRYCTLLSVLLHEMGHVDDVEKARNLRFDKTVDLVAAEVYANRYAFRRMVKEKLRFPLGLLMGSILKDSREQPKDSISRIVGEVIVSSGEFRQLRDFVGDLVDVEFIAGESSI
ncbi:hypothetical protein [Singulisphaera sp. PoT]|uniref:hypothetical protein n=1 Tax=Singulisphaera sp. PoT TaxID=3411797 RepID=UPI003BF5BB9D